MNKQYYFMAGLPRSGSTLLKAILEQNPNIYASPISPVMELMYWTEDYFKRSEQYKAYPKPKIAYNIISGMMNEFYADVDKPIIIDHCRAWPNNIQRIKTYLTEDPKIICPVRDVLDILTSFITMIHRNSDQVSFIDQHLIDNGILVNDDTRCDFLMSDVGIVEQSLWAQYQAFIKKDTKHMLFVEYEDLISQKEKTMKRIYDFLGVDYYQHDFNNVINNHREMDTEVWNLKDMHYVRKEVKKISLDPKNVLSQYIINKYRKLEYWKYSDSPYFNRERHGNR